MSSTHTSPTPSQHEDRLGPAFTTPPRKMASTGGGRAWSEEEENYLIETRQHKMPYKHIAAHLNKTELACRLHYHQLSFGTKRRQGRRRTSSVSSARSSISGHSGDGMVVQQRPLPQLSPPASPEQQAARRSQSPPSQTPLPPAQHGLPPPSAPLAALGGPVPILPKPVCGPHHAAGGAFPSAHNALRLITADVERYEDRNRVDRARLARIYEAHRGHFWAAVARDYGDHTTPAVLEDVWWRGAAGGHFPPTPPNRSPQSPKAAPLAHPIAPPHARPAPVATFQPVNAPPRPVAAARGSFAIASLLTEDKEIGSTPAVAAH